jgi:hypothetical protein
MNAIIVRWIITNLLDCPSANLGGNFNSGLPQGAKHEKVIGRRRGPAGDGWSVRRTIVLAVFG